MTRIGKPTENPTIEIVPKHTPVPERAPRRAPDKAPSKPREPAPREPART